MKLSELDPHWVGLMPGHAWGITFLCPHCRKTRIGVAFDVPIGAEKIEDVINRMAFKGKTWHRDGDTFETLNLSPSIDTQTDHGHWHGHVKNGEIT